MNAVTLIQCTNSKRNQPAPARNLYDPSGYFRDMRAWAQSRGDPWFILSAEHGLVPPERRLAPYDERGISESQAREIATELWRREFDTVHVTAGRDYTRHLVPELEERGLDVVNHFAGEPIGRRRHLLQTETTTIHE